MQQHDEQQISLDVRMHCRMFLFYRKAIKQATWVRSLVHKTPRCVAAGVVAVGAMWLYRGWPVSRRFQEYGHGG
jgi:hypothetical protein